jgi:bifunctional enzyme CysN/CysC
LAFQLEQRLFKAGFRTYVLDGDNIRQGLSADLEFSPADRSANIRRVGEVAALFAAAGLGVITAFISPYRSDRAGARKPVKGNFHEIYLSAGLVVCEKRDPKGLYKKARRGEISKFTRVTAPCEAPASPKLTIDTSAITVK